MEVGRLKMFDVSSRLLYAPHTPVTAVVGADHSGSTGTAKLSPYPDQLRAKAARIGDSCNGIASMHPKAVTPEFENSTTSNPLQDAREDYMHGSL
jgi:hypothetical protein